MRIIVTGAGGFVGRQLVEHLAGHEVIALDHIPDAIPALPGVTVMGGNLCDPSIVAKAFDGGCDAVIHLATVPGGAAEQDPVLAKDVNVDATMALTTAAAAAGAAPRFVFASSIAVFGDPLPASVDDTTPLAPKMYYGAHKAMMEEWLATLTRRRELQALSLRLSGVVARPKGPSGMKSAFLSNVFHALHAGESFVMPVSGDATCWLTSVECATSNFAHALTVELDAAPLSRAATLPTLRVRIADLVAEIALQTGCDIHRVSYEPDEALEAGFGTQPPVSTAAADALGFASDGDLATLVSRALAAIGG